MLSVIIPTHNRRESLGRVLNALSACKCSVPFEVVITLDGCTDGTREGVQSMQLPYPVKMVELPGLGAAAARNAGAAHSAGELLLFLDDDVIPEPGMLEAHVRMRKAGFQVALVGPYPYAPELPVNPMDFFIRDWWARRHEILADPSHTFTYQDCLTGNISIPRDVFDNVGGFDETFRKAGREDYELGVRLLDAGVLLSYAPDAEARHYTLNMPKSMPSKWFTLGMSDVYFCNKHPNVLETLPVVQYWAIPPLIRSILKAAYPLVCRNPERLMGRIGEFFNRRPELLWKRRMLGFWHVIQKVAYLMGILSTGEDLRRLERIAMDRFGMGERARNPVSFATIQIGCPPKEVADTCGANRRILAPRLDEKYLGFVSANCSRGEGVVRSPEVADALAWVAGWQVAENALLQRERIRRDEPHEQAVWNSFIRAVSAGFVLSLSSCNGKKVCRRRHEGIARIDLQEGPDGIDLKENLLAILSECREDAVVLALPGDELDPGWQETVYGYLRDGIAHCVVLPAVLRSVRLRGEELYHRMAGFDKVMNWWPVRLDYLPMAYVLNTFPTCAHRMVFNRRVLEETVRNLGGSYRNYDHMIAAILIEMVRRYRNIIYDPKTPVWHTGSPDVSEVRRISAGYSYLVAMEASALLRSGGPGRCRTIRALRKMASFHVRKLAGSAAGRWNWPVTFACSEAIAFVRGSVRGLFLAGKDDGGIL